MTLDELIKQLRLRDFALDDAAVYVAHEPHRHWSPVLGVYADRSRSVVTILAGEEQAMAVVPRSCPGPWLCRYPEVGVTPAGARWTCPGCGTRYRMTKPVKERPWRNWSAPHGHWVMVRRWTR